VGAEPEFESIPVVDCHLHLTSYEDISNLLEIVSEAGFHRVSALSIIDEKRINHNPDVLLLKTLHPEMFYAFGSLDYSLLNGVSAPSLPNQVDRLLEIGFDGIKMVEGKPVYRKILKIRFDDHFYDEYFKRVEEAGLPVLWHVADPEEFWDPEKVPIWAREQGWFYDDTYPSKEELYEETENVLNRHPALKIIFAHFYFISADIETAERFLDTYRNVNLDLTPGIEMYSNFSKRLEEWREFFIRHQDRILFGTDIFGGEKVETALAKVMLVRSFLELEEGLNLPRPVLEKIYFKNFQRIVGRRPRRLRLDLAAEECGRLARQEAVLGSKPVEETAAWRVKNRIK